MAWVSVASLPIAFVMAMLTGEGLLAMMGYGSGDGTMVPIGVVLIAGVPALLLLVAPAVTAVLCGRRAVRAGRTAGRVPATIGGAIGLLALILNVLPFVVARLA